MIPKERQRSRFATEIKSCTEQGLITRNATYKHDPENGSLEFLFLPQKESSRIYYDCSPLLGIPGCAISFARALSRQLDQVRRSTAQATIMDLKLGFVAFAQEEEIAETLEVADIDTTLINKFIDDWLSRKEKDGSFERSKYVRIHMLGALRKVLEGCRQLDIEMAEDCEIRKNPWPSTTPNLSSIKKPKIFTKGRAIAFYKYCKQCIEETINNVNEIWEDETISNNRIARRVEMGRSIVSARSTEIIPYAKYHFGAAFPERKALRDQDDPLFEPINKYGYKRLARAFGPYAADLCPFVYYLLYVTGFNVQPLVDIKASDVRKIDSFGRQLITISSRKNRAKSSRYDQGKIVRASFTLGEDPLSPASVIMFLLRWTSYLRSHSDAPEKEYLFLYIPRNRKDPKRLDTYAHHGERSSNFYRNTIAFCKKAKFDWMGARNIRDIVAEIGDEILSGDVVQTARLLHHSSTSTTQKHYQNAGVRQRQEQHLAHGMMLRQRWINSNGSIEPRSVDTDHDQSAATPGFRCIDPMDSPVAGQKKGHLCTALGMCPQCPMAMVDIENDYAAARCVELKVAMLAARVRLGHAGFESRWGASFRSLTNYWLPAFSQSVLERAARRHLTPLPDLE